MAEGGRLIDREAIALAAMAAYDLSIAVEKMQQLYHKYPQLNDLQPSNCPIGDLDGAAVATLHWYLDWKEKLA